MRYKNWTESLRMKLYLLTLVLNLWFLQIQYNPLCTVYCSGPHLMLSASKKVTFPVLDITSSESKDKIYRLPPPGGTVVPDEIMSALRVSFGIIRYLLKLPITRTLLIDVVVDIDFDTMVGQNRSNFQRLVYHHLSEKFHHSGFEVRNLFVQKGSVKISYEVGRVKETQDVITNCDFHTTLLRGLIKRYRTCYSKLYSRSSISATKPNHYSAFDLLSSRRNSLSGLGVKKLQKRSVPEDTSPSLRLEVDFIVDVTYPAVAGNRHDEFVDKLKRQIARQIRVPLSSMKDFNLRQDGGMHVTFWLVATDDGNNVMDDRTVMDAGDYLKSCLRDKQLRLYDLNGKEMMTTKYRVYTPCEKATLFGQINLGLLISVLVLMVIMVILLCAFSSDLIKRALTPPHMKRAKDRKRNKSISTESFIDVNTGRDSNVSLGKYSYDSGRWLGPGPEPIYSVPEAPYYRPPTVQEVSSTPRPATSVRTRLKKHWNIDPDQTLPSIPDGVESSSNENTGHPQQHHKRPNRDGNRFRQASVPESKTDS